LPAAAEANDKARAAPLIGNACFNALITSSVTINPRTFNTTAVAGVLLLGSATAAFAATHGEFDNMCAEGLALHKDIKTDCSVNASVKGKTYCFGNEQA
jgi:hypothetical protein